MYKRFLYFSVCIVLFVQCAAVEKVIKRVNHACMYEKVQEYNELILNNQDSTDVDNIHDDQLMRAFLVSLQERIEILD